MLRLVICTLVLSTSVTAVAQDLVDRISEIKYGEIPNEQLLMSEFPADTTACAVMLSEVGDIYIHQDVSSVYTVTTKHYRMKILDDRCKDYGDIKLQYLSYKGAEKIQKLKAQTVLPTGQKIPVEKDQIFTEQINDYLSSINFSFPQVQKGAILEFEYSHLSNRLSVPNEWAFQGSIPRIISGVKLNAPDWVLFESLGQFSENMTDSILPDGTTVKKGEQSTFYKTPNGWHIMENIPALDNEPFISSIHNYRSRIRFQIRELFLDGRPISILTNWFVVNDGLWGHENFGKQVENRSNYMKAYEELSPEFEKIPDPLEKAKGIYYTVTDAIEWTGEFSMYTDKDINTVFEEKKGSSAEINLMLAAFLKEAGYEVFPMLVSTRAHGHPIETVPMISQFNHVALALAIEDQSWLIDGAGEFIPFGLSPVNSLNERALLLADETVNWIDVNPDTGSDTYFMQYELDSLGNPEGTIKARYKNYNAYYERKSHKEDKEKEKWEDRLGESLTQVKVEEVECRELENEEEDFEEQLRFSGEGNANAIGDFLYVKPVLYSAFSKNQLKAEERMLPVEFAYPFAESVIVQMKIPDGYEVEQLPENTETKMLDGSAAFKFLSNAQGGNIMCKLDFYINRTRYAPQEYENLRRIFINLEEKLQEQIVLIKSQNDEEE